MMTVQEFDIKKHLFPCKFKGKTPLTKNGFKDASNDPQVIEQWRKQYPNCNWGLATGEISGVFVLDMDINHAQGKYGDISLDELESIHGKLPETATVLTGGGGKHLYFKMPQGVKIKSSAGSVAPHIDVRADGGYVIYPGSTHENGRTYEWESEFDPYEDGMPFADAPKWLIDDIKEKNLSQFQYQQPDGTFASGTEWDCMADSQREDFINALSVLPNFERDHWKDVGMSIHSMDHTQNGFEIWDAWSKNCPKYDAKDQARVWCSFKVKRDKKRNKESVFHDARALGWQKKEVILQLTQKEQEGDKLIDEMVNKVVHDPDEYKADEPVDYDFPQDCNLLNRLSGFICDATDYNVKAATTQAVIAIAALIASRRYTTPFGDDCNLYLGVASSGSLGEIRYCQELVAAILKRCDLHKMIHKGSFSSRSQIYRTLYKSPTTLYLCDNFGYTIRQTTRQSSGSAEIMLGTLSDIFDAKEGLSFNCLDEAGLSKSDIRNGDDEYKPEIARPCLSTLSLMDNGQLAAFTKKSEIERGGTEQFLFVICDKKDIENCGEEKPIFIPEDVIDDIYKVKGWNRVLKSRTFEEISNQFISLNIASTLTPVTFECDLTAYDNMIEAIKLNNTDLRSFKQAARKNMRRLMTVLAAFNNSGNPVATKPMMDWCAQYTVKNLQRLINRLSVASTEDGSLNVRDKVIEKVYLAGAEGIAKSRLTDIRAFAALPDEKRDQLLEQLVKDKIIALNVTTKQISGRSKKRIVHSSYISKSASDFDDD
jgi:hypothetical protein